MGRPVGDHHRTLSRTPESRPDPVPTGFDGLDNRQASVLNETNGAQRRESAEPLFPTGGTRIMESRLDCGIDAGYVVERPRARFVGQYAVQTGTPTRVVLVRDEVPAAVWRQGELPREQPLPVPRRSWLPSPSSVASESWEPSVTAERRIPVTPTRVWDDDHQQCRRTGVERHLLETSYAAVGLQQPRELQPSGRVRYAPGHFKNEDFPHPDHGVVRDQAHPGRAVPPSPVGQYRLGVPTQSPREIPRYQHELAPGRTRRRLPTIPIKREERLRDVSPEPGSYQSRGDMFPPRVWKSKGNVYSNAEARDLWWHESDLRARQEAAAVQRWDDEKGFET